MQVVLRHLEEPWLDPKGTGRELLVPFDSEAIRIEAG